MQQKGINVQLKKYIFCFTRDLKFMFRYSNQGSSISKKDHFSLVIGHDVIPLTRKETNLRCVISPGYTERVMVSNTAYKHCSRKLHMISSFEFQEANQLRAKFYINMVCYCSKPARSNSSPVLLVQLFLPFPLMITWSVSEKMINKGVSSMHSPDSATSLLTSSPSLVSYRVRAVSQPLCCCGSLPGLLVLSACLLSTRTQPLIFFRFDQDREAELD